MSQPRLYLQHLPERFATAAVGLLANRHEVPHGNGLRPLLPILVSLFLLVVIAGASPVGRSLAQGPLSTFIQHSQLPDAPPLLPPQQSGQIPDGQQSSRSPVRYVAPMLRLWLHVLERTPLPWAVPLILGLLTLVLGLIVLMLLTRSPISHVLRMLTPPLLILGGAVVASMAAVAIVVIVALILSTAAFETRFGFLHSITDPHERRRVAASIRRMASLDEALLVANPREAVIALFYMGVAALQDLALSLTRGETSEELVIRARERSEPVASFLDLLVAAFYRARYSDQDVQLQQAIASRDAHRSLVAAVKTEIESKRASRSRVVTVK